MVNECTRHPYLVFPPQHFLCPEFGEGGRGVAELYLYLSVFLDEYPSVQEIHL